MCHWSDELILWLQFQSRPSILMGKPYKRYSEGSEISGRVIDFFSPFPFSLSLSQERFCFQKAQSHYQSSPGWQSESSQF